MTTPEPVEELVRDCLAFRVRLIARAVCSIYDRAVAGHGMSIAQVNMLAALGKIGSCSPGKLGAMIQLERSTVSRNLDLLLEQRWVEAVVTDAKGVREVALTASGLRKIEEVMPAWRAAQEEATRLLGQAGSDAIREVAGTVWGNQGT